MIRLYTIITTINAETKAIREFKKYNSHIVVVADEKTPLYNETENFTFLSLKKQSYSKFQLAKKLPFSHYARKNLGYLHAIAQGATVIFDTDDDNIPKKNWNHHEDFCTNILSSSKRFLNVYRYFTDDHIWPRGYPIDEVLINNSHQLTTNSRCKIGVWQSVVNGDPDVDAIYRLVIGKPVKFGNKSPVAVAKGNYAPFNSQATTWFKKVFPLMYLPATVSFRFTDILRGYIAQRIMWGSDFYVGWCSPTVYQVRNKHNLLKDFHDEIECYTLIKKLVQIIDSVILEGDFYQKIYKIYNELTNKNVIKTEELELIKLWINDCKLLIGE